MGMIQFLDIFDRKYHCQTTFDHTVLIKYRGRYTCIAWVDFSNGSTLTGFSDFTHFPPERRPVITLPRLGNSLEAIVEQPPFLPRWQLGQNRSGCRG